MRNKSPASLLLLFFLLCFGGNNLFSQETGPVLHFLSSKELRTIMGRMNQLVYEREMTALQTREVRAKQMDDLVAAVIDLVNSAEGLTTAMPGLELDKKDKITFEALARQLLSEASNMKQFAEQNDYISMDSAYQKLDDTCNACHRLFRF